MNIDFLKGIKIGVSQIEGEFLMGQAKACPTNLAIVEIGSWNGSSTAWMGHGSLSSNKAKIYAIDPHLENTYETFLENMNRSGVESVVVPMKETSLDAHKKWDGKRLGFLWIDGDHDYQGVALDIDLWSPDLADGKVIAFHDVTHRWMGVYRAVKEKIIGSRHYKKISFANGILYATKTEKPYPIILWLGSRALIMTRFYLKFLKQDISKVVKPIVKLAQ